MLVDKSRGDRFLPAANVTLFESVLANNGVSPEKNLVAPLTNVDFDGVGIFWIDAADSDSGYTEDEAITIYHFVRSGGALLVTLASSPDREAGYRWIEKVLNQFFIHRRSMNLPTPSNQSSCQPTIAQPDHPLANGIDEGFTFQLTSAAGGGLTFLDTERELQPVFSFGNDSFEDPIVIAGEFFPRGKIVIVWDVGVLDDAVIQNVDNLRFATNLVSYLKADCDNKGCQGKCGNAGIEKCYKDYCYCLANYTGDTCKTPLTPCQYEGGCLPAQQTPCSWINPVRCPSGACIYSPSACALARRCPVPCADGSCGNVPSDCMNNTNCPNITCADGSCVDDINDCDIVPSCSLAMPFRCPDGSCIANTSACPTPPVCSIPGEQLCMDGVCRPKCPRYDGCRADTKPFQCSEFSCVTDKAACMTTCGGENTTLCWDGFCTCTGYINDSFVCAPCSRPASYYKPVSMEVLVPTGVNMTIPIVNKDPAGKGEHLLSVYIEAGTFTDEVTLIVKEIAVGNLRDEKLGDFLRETLSSLVDLKVAPALPLQLPILIKFFVTPPSQDLGANIFNASLTFLDESALIWTPISLSTVEAVIPIRYFPKEGTVQPPTDPPPSPPPKTLGGGATHFTTFSVILGNGESKDGEESSGGDGDLAIILPAVLVPVGVGVVLMVVLGIVVGGVVIAWWKKMQFLHSKDSITAVNF